jgi:flagellar hook capping protein FlgD/beta-propeller repeat-containing protein
MVSAGGTDIFLAKYNASGTHLWSKRFGDVNLDSGYTVAADGLGNVLVSGYFAGTTNFGGGDLTSTGTHDAFVAKYNAGGAHQWSRRFGGTGTTETHAMAVDGSGNVALVGNFGGIVDFGGGNLSSTGWDMFVARYNANGGHQWSKRFWGESAGIAADGAGNVFVTGSFYPNADFGGLGWVSAGSSDVFIAKFDPNGVHQWSQGFGGRSVDQGRAVAASPGNTVVMVGGFADTVDFGGGNIASVGGMDIFVARYGNKLLINNINDVAVDQGKQVYIGFQASPHDASGMDPYVTQYQAYRWTDLGWVYAAEIPASGANDYVMDAPTDVDSTRSFGQHYSKFFIRALTSQPETFYDSPVDSGYSVDNLAPGIPANLVYSSGQLSWDESTAPDFDHFSVYGSNTNSFASAIMVDYTVTPALNVASLPYSFYFVSATDHSGNEGGPANVGTVTGVGGMPSSYVLSVSAYPNPFNPETCIRYTLPARSRVTIDVFDARGAHVATLVDAVAPAGAYTVAWKGQDNGGSAVSSGVYFARLASAAGVRTYKMTLLK